MSREDSMAASGPSQAKHTAKESSGEEKRVEETGGKEKELRTLAKTGGGGEERRGQKRNMRGERVMKGGTLITRDTLCCK